MSQSVEQAIRTSHCSHEKKETHNCVGSCTITPRGIELRCSLCGDEDRTLYEDPNYKKLALILRVINIDIGMISLPAVYTMIKEMQ